MKSIPAEFATTPVVYAVGKNYQILVPVNCETLMWVSVGDKCYYDDSNGILRSAVTTHKMTIPMEELDKEKKYTVCYRRIIERKPYFSETGEVEYYESEFRPVEKSPVNIYHIADAHNRVEQPVAAGRYFGNNLDLLVLNGDIPNHSGKIEYFTAIHQIASELTSGEIPTVFSRGNHDTRGIYAENIADHTPTDNGCSYYSFRLGHIWGLVLDCGEDKPDTNAEYGNTICCADFRRRETDYIKKIIANSNDEYLAEGVTNRIVIVHNPFTQTFNPPFDIEQETFGEWAKLLKDHIKPQFMLCGHVHKCYISPVGSERDHKGQPCVVITASRPQKEGPFGGGAITLDSDGCRVVFNDSDGNVFGDEYIKF